MKYLLPAGLLLTLAPLGLLGAARPGAAPDRAAQEARSEDEVPTIAVAAMLAGTWRETRPGAAGDAIVEELWSAPAGDNVVGAFRWIAPDGRASMYELLAITAESEGVFLRLRHFGADLEAWEARDEPKTLRLVEATPTSLRFAAHAHCADLAGVVYDRSEEDVLAIEVSFDELSSRAPLRFRLRRT